jgi:hypothetical protein
MSNEWEVFPAPPAVPLCFQQHAWPPLGFRAPEHCRGLVRSHRPSPCLQDGRTVESASGLPWLLPVTELDSRLDLRGLMEEASHAPCPRKKPFPPRSCDDLLGL